MRFFNKISLLYGIIAIVVIYFLEDYLVSKLTDYGTWIDTALNLLYPISSNFTVNHIVVPEYIYFDLVFWFLLIFIIFPISKWKKNKI